MISPNAILYKNLLKQCRVLNTRRHDAADKAVLIWGEVERKRWVKHGARKVMMLKSIRAGTLTLMGARFKCFRQCDNMRSMQIIIHYNLQQDNMEVKNGGAEEDMENQTEGEDIRAEDIACR
ncbi:hypothetical protein PILCRDRAFT_86048 [Piloderma croceum F 1598]|uniref:Uncharacterized protein n=1 Tax=Piloderma croceum (strain F 1598) TaxID=765440 RepID=A0A0C3G864_PILCF|nr:hypothetical protein PILCRDRAFT_86048 [Piloderma croceum F 1598]